MTNAVCSDSTLRARFEKKVILSMAPDECWDWKGATYSFGYGCIGTSRGLDSAHRVSFSLNVGPIPDGLCVLHKCDNPKCANPRHLFLGTKGDNAIDRESKKRGGCIAPRGEASPSAKLTRDNIFEIRASNMSNAALARKFGVGDVQIGRIKSRKRWGWLS